MSAKCKGCGAEIVFVRTENGKMMPCNPRLVPYWERQGAKGKILNDQGRVVSCDFHGEREKLMGFGHMPHFSTCAAAKRFRREKKEAAESGQISIWQT